MTYDISGSYTIYPPPPKNLTARPMKNGADGSGHDPASYWEGVGIRGIIVQHPEVL